MKRLMNVISIMLVVVLLTGCSERKEINGKVYDTYGILNSDSKANPYIEYEISVGNLILGILLVETIIAPVYFFGFDIMEPVGPRITDPSQRGIVGIKGYENEYK